MQSLTTILSMAYSAQVMGNGSIEEAYAAFKEAAVDPAFVQAAQEAQVQYAAVPQQRCFASFQHATFLTQALTRLAKEQDAASAEQL